MSKHFGGIINNSMQNGLQINLKDAIEDVGVKVPATACLWQYPEIIRNNLIAKTLNNVNLLGKDVINITSSTDGDSLIYNISTKYDTKDILRPNYSTSNDSWGNELSVKDVFNDLFNNILPYVKGVHAGDITTSDESGNDNKIWINSLFDKSGNKTGLIPNSKYLRLYLTCQAEPIYIFIDSNIGDLTGGYNIISTDTISIEVDDTNMTISANIACITNEQINAIS